MCGSECLLICVYCQTCICSVLSSDILRSHGIMTETERSLETFSHAETHISCMMLAESGQNVAFLTFVVKCVIM